MAVNVVRVVRVASILGMAMLLAACTTDAPSVTPTTTSAAVVTPSSTPEPTLTEDPATPTPTPTPTATATGIPADLGTPVTIGCNSLVTPQAMYDFNPNFSLSDTYKPKAGSRASTIAGYQGRVCEWVNDSSGEKIDIAVAHLGSDTLDAIGNKLVTTSKSVPTYGVEGYFTVAGDIGRADALTKKYWLVADSTFFSEPGDAEPLVSATLAALGR